MGLAILGPLRDLDEIAYLRFASVYRAYEGLEDFEAEIALLRAERDLSTTGEQPDGSPPTNSDVQQQLASSTAP